MSEAAATHRRGLRVAITGAAGFLGWHLRAYLHSLGCHEVVPIDRACLNDPARLEQAVRDCDAVVHLAGLNRADEEAILRVNPELARTLVSACQRAHSTPHVVFANSTHHLIADMERLRAHLAIDRWVVFGGSWGSTLALAYGQAYPERCHGSVLRGIFLGQREEIEWFLYGLRRFFPEAWQAFVEDIPEPERSNLLHAYFRRLVDPDPEVHMPAARTWSSYEGACSTLRPVSPRLRPTSTSQSALNLARIEAHYFVNEVFIPPQALLNGLDRIRHLPCFIVQGRYDAICPIVTADTLARAWPQARYVIVPDAGHSAWEPGILAALIKATEDMKSAISNSVPDPG